MQFFMLNAETSVAAGKKSDAASLSMQEESGFASVFADEMAEQLAAPSAGPSTATSAGQEIAAAVDVTALIRQKVSAADTGKTPELLPVAPALPATASATETVISDAQLLQLALAQNQTDTENSAITAALLPDAGQVANSTDPALAAVGSPWLELISAAEQYSATLTQGEVKTAANLQSAAEQLSTEKSDSSLQAGMALSAEAKAQAEQSSPALAGLKPTAAQPTAAAAVAATEPQSEQPTASAAANTPDAKPQPELMLPNGAAQAGKHQDAALNLEALSTSASQSEAKPAGQSAATELLMLTTQADNTASEPQSVAQLAEKTLLNDKAGQSRVEAVVTTPQQLAQQNSQTVADGALQTEVVLNAERQPTAAPVQQAMTNAAQLSFADHQKAANAADALSKQQQFKAEQATGAEAVSVQNGQQSGRSDAFSAALTNALPEQQFQSLTANGGDKSPLLTPAQQAHSPALATQQSSAASQTAALKTAEAQLPTLYLQEPQAAAQLKDRVMYQVQQKIQSAEIRLAPEELGSVQIKVNLQQDQLSVQFVVQQAQAKEALEQQMPRLKELLQQQGVELTDSQVSQQQQQQQQGEKQAKASSRQLANTELVDEALPQQVTLRSSDRMVDYYA